ncbi:AbrB/MazE/SpoVT family DNA-binding domain-containing protein [Haloprofundus salinisoli]|uniref:AbrB/MazE/SpoVT family DNA-binding domain-containing protein n=1 Tax=Haloprofundus salinisoli TaxID=2876193 RepID=UPI001CCCABA5|nr:hypothetical protein [Haloprofundus salinisoli]
MSEEGTEMHGKATIQEDGSSVVVTLPKEAVEHSGVEIGEQVNIGSTEDGPVVLLPWSEDDIREIMDE